MSEGINFCTKVVSFFGFGCDTVNAAHAPQGDNPNFLSEEEEDFLLEDATTIYLYVSVEDSFDSSNRLDVGNLCMSLTSGVLSLFVVLLMTCGVYPNNGNMYNLVLFALTGVFMAIPTWLAFEYLLLQDKNASGNGPLIAMGVSSFFGYFFFAYLLAALCMGQFCGDTLGQWPTNKGMVPQGTLRRGGAGSPNNDMETPQSLD